MIRAFVIGLTLVSASVPSFASCAVDGKPSESVHLSIQGTSIDRWDTVHGQIHRVRLPSGYQVGVRIDPTTEEKYRELLTKMPAVDELVKITLFDMNGAKPAQISETWGGTNSTQGLRAQGADTSITAKSDQFELRLHKPVLCITSATVGGSTK